MDPSYLRFVVATGDLRDKNMGGAILIDYDRLTVTPLHVFSLQRKLKATAQQTSSVTPLPHTIQTSHNTVKVIGYSGANL